jgi:Cu-Zn family superoxide dismutase
MKFYFSILMLFIFFVTGLWFFGGRMKHEGMTPKLLVCHLQPTLGNTVKGVVKIYAEEKGVKVVAYVENLTPGPHGFHIHSYGDLRDPNGGMVGPHYMGMAHSGHNMNKPMGDMKMLMAGKDGKAELEMIIPSLQISELAGRAVLVHAHEDRLVDGKMDSGPKVAMGVLGIANKN